MKNFTLIFLSLFFCFISFGQSRYYKAQMHCHSTNSDGGYSPQDLVNKYKAQGYEIMFITDHNVLTLESEVNVPEVLVIQSEELTFERHMNGFFLTEVIIPDNTCQNAIDAVKQQNGLIQLNHYCAGPVTEDSWEVSAQEIISFTNGPDFLEIWNTGTETIQTHDDKSIWDEVLTTGKVVWGSATDDFHPSALESLEFNKGWNMIWLDSLSSEAVYDALVNGRFYASTGVEISDYNVTDFGNAKNITVQCENCEKIQFWGPGHTLLQEVSSSTASYYLANEQYVRCELIHEGFLGIGNSNAWTQPVFRNNSTDALVNENKLQLSVYPNPAVNEININLYANQNEFLNVEIHSITGAFVTSLFSGNIHAGNFYVKSNVSNLKTGIYLLSIDLGFEKVVKKISIVN